MYQLLFTILMSQHVISIREIIAITLTMAKRTDFVDRPAPVDGLSTQGCDTDLTPDGDYGLEPCRFAF